MWYPVGEPDPIKRLKQIEKHYQDVKYSTIPLSTFFAAPFLGSLFVPIVKGMIAPKNITGVISNMPGPKAVFFKGAKVEDVSAQALLGHGDITFLIASFTYDDDWKFVMSARGDIMDEEDLQNFFKSVEKEFEFLRTVDMVRDNSQNV